MSDTPRNKSHQNTVIIIAGVTAFVLVGSVIFGLGQVYGDVKHLEDEIVLKADTVVVDAQILSVSELVAANSNLMKVQITNIEKDIGLIQQDIHQLRISMQNHFQNHLLQSP